MQLIKILGCTLFMIFVGVWYFAPNILAEIGLYLLRD